MPRPTRSKKIDRFFHERQLLEQGERVIAGIDEAGRGPLAGPVVAASVVLPIKWVAEGIPDYLSGLNDSKQLSERRREEFYDIVSSHPEIVCSVAQCDSDVIDTINILEATHRAMNLSIDGLGIDVDHGLVDGRPVKSLSVQQTALVKGDSLSFSIAAASVLAKVSRDRQMLKWDEEYPEYGFRDHKGYGTAQHLSAIRDYGPCPIHRMTFAPLKPTQPELF